MATIIERVEESRKRKAEVVGRFGFVPMSILRFGRGKLSRSMFVYQHEEPSRHNRSDPCDPGELTTSPARKAAARQAEAKENGIARFATCANDQTSNRIQTSIMPAELVDFFVKYYAKAGDVYVDPFIGQGIRMQVAHLRGLHYHGYDASTEFMAYVRAIIPKIKRPDGPEINVTLGDSRHPDNIPDGVGDFSFHSPPYWDIEYYGDEPEQLGKLGGYAAFLDGMRDVYRAWLPKFKPGAFHCINVNDFRRDGVLIPYHADTIRAATDVGWTLHDTWIIDGLVGGAQRMFGVDAVRRRLAPRVHEYVLVFRAP